MVSPFFQTPTSKLNSSLQIFFKILSIFSGEYDGGRVQDERTNKIRLNVRSPQTFFIMDFKDIDDFIKFKFPFT